MNEIERQQLDEMSNASGQQNQPQQPHGHSLVRPTQGLAERVVGAQPVAVKRDLPRIRQEIREIAAMAGEDWFYRFPVRTQSGGQDWIQGASIKLTNNVARIYGNNINEVREVDVGDAWVFYARFTDIETGFSMERAFHQRKSQTSLKTKDRDRQMDIAYQIGQSKAIRNCINNALGVYCDFAFEEAQKSIVEKIGKDLQGWIERTVERLKVLPVDLRRVERVIGRPAASWLAPDVARVIMLGQSVRDGMAALDDVFPPDEEIITGQDNKTDVGTESGTATESGTTQESGTAAAESSEKTQTAAATPQAATPQQDGLFVDPIRAATQRGKDDRAAGQQRRAVPPEYREKQALAAAWQQGWDQADKESKAG
jgi:hypothetical protein